MGSEEDEDDDNDEEVTLTLSSKLQLVLAPKSRKLHYTSSPVISQHVSLSLLSSPDDSSSHSRASVPFSWEDEPGKPKHHILLPAPPCSTCLRLPPRLLPPPGFTKMPSASDHPHHLAGLKRWFRWRKERPGDDDDVAVRGSFVFPAEYEDDTKTTRTRGLHCLSHVTRCYFWVK